MLKRLFSGEKLYLATRRPPAVDETPNFNNRRLVTDVPDAQISRSCEKTDLCLIQGEAGRHNSLVERPYLVCVACFGRLEKVAFKLGDSKSLVVEQRLL